MAIALVGTLALLRMAFLHWGTAAGLGPDEAQYWHWLAYPDWSYVTKPPLTTWLIGLSTSLLGDTLPGVRLFALLGQAAGALLAFAIAGFLAGRKAAWWALGLTASAPLVAIGGLLMSPDAVLTPLWLAALYLLVRQTSRAQHKPLNWAPWLLIGVLVGLGGLAKYTAAFFYPLMLLALLITRPDWLRRPQPYVAGLVSLLMQAPVIWWNATHNWAGLHHLLWQANPNDSDHGGLFTLLEFLGGQLLVIGLVSLPVMLCAWFIAARRWKMQSSGIKLLWVFTAPIFLAFLAQTMVAKVQMNWPLLATVPALSLVAVYVAAHPQNWLRRAVLGGLILNAAFSAALTSTNALRAVGIPLPIKSDPTKDTLGWPGLGRITGTYLQAMAPGTVLLSTRYQTTAQLAFHTPGNPQVLYLNSGNYRSTQYDYWAWPNLTGKLVLYVNEKSDVLPEVVKQRFQNCEPYGRAAVSEHGAITRRATYHLCWNALPQGAPQPVPPQTTTP